MFALNRNLLQPLPEVLLPAFRQRSDHRGAPHPIDIGCTISFCAIKPSDLRDWHRVWLSTHRHNFIARSYFTLANNRKIEPRSSAREESLYHVVGFESDAQLVAGKARLRYHHFRRTHRELIAKMNGFLLRAIKSEILSKDTHWQLSAPQLSFPVFVVHDWVAVDSLIFSAVDAEVSLTVAL